MIKKIFGFLLGLVSTQTTSAQKKSTTQLYPLKVGNQWAYEVKEANGEYYEIVEEVVESKEFFGHIFYRINDSGWEYYRNTEQGEVEIVAYEEGMIEPMITGFKVTKPCDFVEKGAMQGLDIDGNKAYGDVNTKAVWDYSIINGYQVSLRIEMIFVWGNGTQFQKYVIFWGSGIGNIMSQTFIQQPGKEELQLVNERTLIKTNFL